MQEGEFKTSDFYFPLGFGIDDEVYFKSSIFIYFLILLPSLGGVYFLFKVEINFIVTVFIIICGILTAYSLFKILDRSPRIKINYGGIYIRELNRFLNWRQIRSTIIRVEDYDSGDSMSTNIHLIIELDIGEKIEISLREIDCSIGEISNAIENFKVMNE